MKTIKNLSDCKIACLENISFGYNEEEQSNFCLIRTNGRTYKYKEDPNDGYRSYCLEPIICKKDELMKLFTNKVYLIKVENGLEIKSINFVDENFEGIYGIDCYTERVVFKIGTDYADSWYPYYRAEFHPENMKINQE